MSTKLFYLVVSNLKLNSNTQIDQPAFIKEMDYTLVNLH
jgi:hypothetical protein